MNPKQGDKAYSRDMDMVAEVDWCDGCEVGLSCGRMTWVGPIEAFRKFWYVVLPKEEKHSELEKTAKRQALKLQAIWSLCLRHCSPGVNIGAHSLAKEVVEIIESVVT